MDQPSAQYEISLVFRRKETMMTKKNPCCGDAFRVKEKRPAYLSLLISDPNKKIDQSSEKESTDWVRKYDLRKFYHDPYWQSDGTNKPPEPNQDYVLNMAPFRLDVRAMKKKHDKISNRKRTTALDVMYAGGLAADLPLQSDFGSLSHLALIMRSTTFVPIAVFTVALYGTYDYDAEDDGLINDAIYALLLNAPITYALEYFVEAVCFEKYLPHASRTNKWLNILHFTVGLSGALGFVAPLVVMRHFFAKQLENLPSCETVPIDMFTLLLTTPVGFIVSYMMTQLFVLLFGRLATSPERVFNELKLLSRNIKFLPPEIQIVIYNKSIVCVWPAAFAFIGFEIARQFNLDTVYTILAGLLGFLLMFLGIYFLYINKNLNPIIECVIKSKGAAGDELSKYNRSSFYFFLVTFCSLGGMTGTTLIFQDKAPHNTRLLPSSIGLIAGYVVGAVLYKTKQCIVKNNKTLPNRIRGQLTIPDGHPLCQKLLEPDENVNQERANQPQNHDRQQNNKLLPSLETLAMLNENTCYLMAWCTLFLALVSTAAGISLESEFCDSTKDKRVLSMGFMGGSAALWLLYTIILIGVTRRSKEKGISPFLRFFDPVCRAAKYCCDRSKKEEIAQAHAIS